MPYSCALAVCATFCAHISGAFIPIFGPTFPSQCVATSHQSYGTMIIEPSIIASATAEAESFRQKYSTASPGSRVMKLGSASPRELLRDVEHLGLHSPANLSHRLRLKRTFTNASMYTTDAENSDTSLSSGDRYPCSPVTPTSSYNGHGWTPDNVYSTPIPNVYSTPTPKRPGLRTALPSFNTSHPPSHPSNRGPTHDSPHALSHPYGHRPALSCGASPWLSAIPRSAASTAESLSTATTMRAPSSSSLNPSPSKLRRSLRRTIGAVGTGRAFDNELDHDYDGEDDGGESPSGSEQSGNSGQSESSEGMEKKAAWLLMNLSVRDGAWAAASTDAANTGAGPLVVNAGNAIGASTHVEIGREARPQLTVEIPVDFAPRVKRRRATSL
jgi:hypothetical protein